MKLEQQGRRVILLPVSLPALSDPLGGIFTEGCKKAFGGRLRPSQITELKENVQSGKAEIVFILDA